MGEADAPAGPETHATRRTDSSLTKSNLPIMVKDIYGKPERRRISMRKQEKTVLEAIKSILGTGKTKHGIVDVDRDETSHRFEHEWNSIEAEFALKCAGSPHLDGLTAAFHDIHSYKYLDDPTFNVSLEKRMTATGIPAEDRTKAQKALGDMLNERKDMAEKDTGWHPQLDEIADMTRNADNRDAKITTPYTGGGPAPSEDGQ